MGLLDRFKKKKEEDSELELPKLPDIDQSSEDDLPPLPEIRVEPEGMADDTSEDDALSDLPDLPDIEESEDDDADTSDIGDDDVPVPKVREDMPEPEPIRRTPIVRKEVHVQRAKMMPSHIFVSSNDYRKILDGVDFLKDRLNSADGHVNSLTFIKEEEEKQIEAMRNILEDVQRKITYVDEVIFQAG